jgi:ribosomal protein S21
VLCLSAEGGCPGFDIDRRPRKRYDSRIIHQRKELSHLSVEVNRKKGESFDAFMRRFQRRYQQSGRNLQSKKVRFHKDEPNRNRVRASALRRQSKKEQYEYLLKTGQLKEEPKKRRKYGRR